MLQVFDRPVEAIGRLRDGTMVFNHHQIIHEVLEIAYSVSL
jgi:hypothetical protein